MEAPCFQGWSRFKHKHGIWKLPGASEWWNRFMALSSCWCSLAQKWSHCHQVPLSSQKHIKKHSLLLAPPYLSARFTRVCDIDGRSHLRSATDGQLVVPHTKTKTIGIRGFHVSGPTFWNYLPRQLRDSDLSLMTFKQHLKTELFRDAIGKRTLQALLWCC